MVFNAELDLMCYTSNLEMVKMSKWENGDSPPIWLAFTRLHFIVPFIIIFLYLFNMIRPGTWKENSITHGLQEVDCSSAFHFFLRQALRTSTEQLSSNTFAMFFQIINYCI